MRNQPTYRRDAFVLCSDGLWGYFSDAEIGGVVAAYSAREASSILMSRARQRAQGEGDNVSLVIIRLVEPTKTTKKS